MVVFLPIAEKKNWKSDSHFLDHITPRSEGGNLEIRPSRTYLILFIYVEGSQYKAALSILKIQTSFDFLEL